MRERILSDPVGGREFTWSVTATTLAAAISAACLANTAWEDK